LNGCTKRNEVGEFTFTGGKGKTVIYYVLEDEGIREKVGKLIIRERVESDHQPLEIWR